MSTSKQSKDKNLIIINDSNDSYENSKIITEDLKNEEEHEIIDFSSDDYLNNAEKITFKTKDKDQENLLGIDNIEKNNNENIETFNWGEDENTLNLIDKLEDDTQKHKNLGINFENNTDWVNETQILKEKKQDTDDSIINLSDDIENRNSWESIINFDEINNNQKQDLTVETLKNNNTNLVNSENKTQIINDDSILNDIWWNDYEIKTKISNITKEDIWDIVDILNNTIDLYKKRKDLIQDKKKQIKDKKDDLHFKIQKLKEELRNLQDEEKNILKEDELIDSHIEKFKDMRKKS